jgi:Flp pilus assembly protein TadG
VRDHNGGFLGAKREAYQMRVPQGDRGAAAVEFALVVPVLLVLVLGIAEFGRAYNVQTTLSSAAREGVRVMALQNSPSAARTSAKVAGSSLALTDAQINVSLSVGTTCVVTGIATAPTATVTVTYPMTFLTNFFGTSITLTGKGVMRCNG